MILKLKTDKQQLMRIDSNEAVENSQNYLTAEFELDSDWTDKSVTALFQKGNITKEIILTEDYSCVVPSEVIRSGGFSVALLGVKGSEVITSNKVIIYVDKTIDASEATSPAEPTKSLYAQLLDRISRLEAEGIAPEVIAQAVADYLEANPIETGITEEECITLINSYIEEHKAELKGDPGATPVKGIDYYTEADKQELIQSVLNSLVTAESVSL